MSFSEPRILGVVNISRDSFSDGGFYLEPAEAIEHAIRLARDGAHAIDLGAASSNPDAMPVLPEEEIRRLQPVVARLAAEHIPVSIDSTRLETQRWALGCSIAYLNDIRGFPNPVIYPSLAQASCKLIVMHSIQRDAKASIVDSDPNTIVQSVESFFDQRIGALESAGIARKRIIIDPGMGYFLGSNPESSLAVLRAIPQLKRRFGLPLMVCVSRKSFLRKLTERGLAEIGAATLAAELDAASHGADYIRTHDVRALRDVLKVWSALGDADHERR